MRLIRNRLTLLLALGLLCVPGLLLAAGQAIVLQQNLSEMCSTADRIYRGTVLSMEDATVDIGGRELPATSYIVEVGEAFKGEVDFKKGGQRYVELKMIGTAKPGPLHVEGDLAALSVLPAPPALQVGEEYLLLTNAPNANGLSMPIGLEQGCFHITGLGKQEIAVNGLNNMGLFKGMGLDVPSSGAIDYAWLATMIRSELEQ